MNIRYYTRLRYRCACCRIRWVDAFGTRCASCRKLATV
jgi:hypothetical protein